MTIASSRREEIKTVVNSGKQWCEEIENFVGGIHGLIVKWEPRRLLICVAGVSTCPEDAAAIVNGTMQAPFSGIGSPPWRRVGVVWVCAAFAALAGVVRVCAALAALDNILNSGIVLLPLSSVQHFIWPLSWCLLADLCNHSWIPECGREPLLERLREFPDECDMLEFNCDHEMDFELTNFSECFKENFYRTTVHCPYRCNETTTTKSTTTTELTVPNFQNFDGRRYHPKKKKFRSLKFRLRTSTAVVRPRRHFRQRSRTAFVKTVTEMIILRKETVLRGGKMLYKVVKKMVDRPAKPFNDDQDFLE